MGQGLGVLVQSLRTSPSLVISGAPSLYLFLSLAHWLIGVIEGHGGEK